MRTLGIIALCIMLLIGGAVAWYKITYPTYTYRYRMTVDVDVAGKVHSGSSVIEAKINTQPPLGSAPLYVAHIRGEAVFVDLGKGRNVIALLAAGAPVPNVGYPESIVPILFDLPFKEWAKLPSLRGTRDVPASRMPTFVTFADINDPKTARIVTPTEFTQVFGAGVNPPNVMITMTNDPVTRGIFQRLPWLAGLKGYMGGQFKPDWSRPEKNLTANLFTSGAL